MGQAAHEIVPEGSAKVFLAHGQRSFFWKSKYQKHPNNKVIKENQEKSPIRWQWPDHFLWRVVCGDGVIC